MDELTVVNSEEATNVLNQSDAPEETTEVDDGIFATQEEIKSGKRFFTVDYNGIQLDLLVRKPVNKEIEIADWEYSRYFNKAITQGIIPESKMLKILKEQSVITDEDEAKMKDLSEKLVKLEIDIEKYAVDRNREALIKAREELRAIRTELWEIRYARTQYLSHTAEVKADNHRTSVFVSLVTEYASGPKKGKKFFENFDAMQIFDDQSVVTACLVNYMTLANGLGVKFLDREFIEDKTYDWEKEEDDAAAKHRGRPKKN